MQYRLRFIGIVISVWGLILLAASIPQAIAGLIVFAVIVLTGGALIWHKGQENLSNLRLCAELALTQLREKEFIDSIDLSTKLRRSEIDIRQMIFIAQKKGMIPFNANIK